MIFKLLTEHHLEFLSLKGGCGGFPSLHLSKCQIVGNLIHWLYSSSTDDLCKQFGPKSGLMWIQTVDTLMVFMKFVFEKVDIEKNNSRQN